MSDIVVGSVGVRLVPNAEGFSTKAKALTQGLTANIKLDADTKVAQAKLDEAAHQRRATIDANADTEVANLELDYAARDRTAKIDADTSGLQGALGGLLGGLSSATSGISGIGAAGLALAPALIPIGASVAGLTAALSVPVVAAGGGLTIFGFIAGKAMKDTDKVGKQIDALKKKALTLSDPAARQAALDQAKALEATLTGPQKAFLASQTELSKAFKSLTEAAGPAIFKPLVAGMDALAGLLPKTAPLLDAVSSALTDVIKSVSKSGAFDSFLNFLTQASGPAIRGFADIAGNIAKGIGGIGKAFEPLAGPLMGAIENMARSFSHIGTSQGLASFVDYVRKNGPLVASTLADVARAAGGLVRDLAPAGPVILQVVDALAKLTIAYQRSGALQKTVTGIGDAFRVMGAAIRTDWNTIIQPVLHGMINSFGHVEVAIGSGLQAMRHFVPGAGAAGDAMVAAGRAAEGLASSIRKIPSHASTLYGFVGQAGALSQIARIRAQLASIPRSISTSYYVNQVNSVSKAPLNLDPTHGKGSAFGGPVDATYGPRTSYAATMIGAAA